MMTPGTVGITELPTKRFKKLREGQAVKQIGWRRTQQGPPKRRHPTTPLSLHYTDVAHRATQLRDVHRPTATMEPVPLFLCC